MQVQGKYDVIDSRQGRSGGFNSVPDPDQRRGGGAGEAGDGGGGKGGARGGGASFDIEAEHRRLSAKFDQELERYQNKPVPRGPSGDG